MKLLYGNKERTHGLPVQDSGGYQVARGVITDGIDKIVLLYDSITDKHYINRLSSPNANLESKNLVKIDKDEAWLSYLTFFKENGLIHDK